ncbi:MAG TPA: DciA family protein [Pseudonocardia sp.]|nr:DciA family protein [Pseudonocardia sp.]
MTPLKPGMGVRGTRSHGHGGDENSGDENSGQASAAAVAGDKQGLNPELTGKDLARDALRAAQEAAAARGGRKPGETPTRWRRNAGGANRRSRRRWSGAGEDDRDPQPLGRLAAKLVADRGWKAPLTEASVFGKWETLVGADVAEHATPVSLKDGELVVAASSTAWATQLRTLQRQLILRIAAGVGDGVVKRIKVQGPVAPSWRKGPRTVRGRGPRDTYG